MRSYDGGLRSGRSPARCGTAGDSRARPAVIDMLIPITEHATSRDVPGLMQSRVCLRDSLGGLLTVSLVGESLDVG